MKSIRTKYLVMVVLVHLILACLAFYALRENRLWFLAVEVVLLFSGYLAFGVYRGLIAPLQLLATGTEAIRDGDFHVRFVHTGRPEMDQLVDVYNTMIDRLREERTLQQQQHYFLEKLVQTSPTGILILNLDERIEQLNPRALSYLNRPSEELLGKTFAETGHPLLIRLAKVQAGESATVTHGHIFKCEKASFVDRGFPRYFLTIEELTSEVLAAERNAYGKVIRMMSHEVNNTLGAVNSLLDTTVHWLEDAPLASALQVAIERNENLGRFTRRLAEVVRLPAPQKTLVDLGELVDQCRRLMEASAAGRKITLTLDAGAGCRLYADRLQLEQVLLNITKNAFEAIGEEGEVRFLLEPSRLIIRNNGKDLTPEEAGQVFTPFFTNKPNGQGIGLTLVREILHAHGFGFSLETTAPGQTDFTIRFPPASRA